MLSAMNVLRSHGLGACSHIIGKPNERDAIEFMRDAKMIFNQPRTELQRLWSETSWRIARLRDNPACADAEYDRILDAGDPGITPKLTFDLQLDVAAPFIATGVRPKVAILREQGVNSHVETAYVMDKSGFTAVDVHMSDLIAGRAKLDDFKGFIAVGGFSYGDVLGAGEGWAKSILFNARARAEFEAFFARADAFALGVCNGCQMMSNLHAIIPGAGHWPRFVQNQSERFEARYASLRIEKSPSVLFADMAGSVIPVAVSHGEGYAEFADPAAAKACSDSGLVAARYVDNRHEVTEQYPLNPNGSPFGMTALTTTTGRVTIMMPHPERVHRSVCMSWAPADWPEDSPWMRLFRNAREWVG